METHYLLLFQDLSSNSMLHLLHPLPLLLPSLPSLPPLLQELPLLPLLRRLLPLTAPQKSLECQVQVCRMLAIQKILHWLHTTDVEEYLTDVNDPATPDCLLWLQALCLVLPARWFSRRTAAPVSWSPSATPEASARPSYATSRSARWRRRSRRSKSKVSDCLSGDVALAHVLLTATRCSFNSDEKVMQSKQSVTNPSLAFSHDRIPCVCVYNSRVYQPSPCLSDLVL